MKIAGIIIGIIGLLLLSLGGYLFVKEQLFLQKAELTTAIVTDNKLYTYTGQVNEYGVQHYYCSEFQFQTKNGQSVSFKEDDGTSIACTELDMSPDYQVGEKVPVYYDPQNPIDTVQIPKSMKLSYDTVKVLIVPGALCVLIGLVMFWIGLLRSRRAATSRTSQKAVL